MKIFEIGKSLNPGLVDGALILINDKIHEVVDMDDSAIFVISKEKTISFPIDDNEWSPIELSDEWLRKFNLEIGSKIRNTITNLDWEFKSTGSNYYLTIHRDPSLGENPVIGVYSVHDLQRWIFILTKSKFVPRY